MNNKYFYIKKTKMIDEASIGHRFMPVFMSIALFVLVYYASSLAAALLQSIPLVIYIMTSKEFSGLINSEHPMDATVEYLEHFSYPQWFDLVDLFSRVAIMIVAILFCKLFEKRRASSLGLRRGGIVLEYLSGLLIGFALFALTVLIAWLTGSIQITKNPDGVSFIVILYFLAFIVQGAAEELIVRGYFMVSLARDTHPWIAILVSALAFSFIHIFNAGINVIALTNIFLVGVLFGVYVFKRGNIWGACAIHTMWNFAQGNIFGVNVSGMDAMPSIFVSLQSDKPGMVILNGGAFGLEGSIICTAIMVGAIALALLLPTKKTEISATEEGYIPTQRKNKKLWEPF